MGTRRQAGVNELARALEAGELQLIDVRTGFEFGTGQIRQSDKINIRCYLKVWHGRISNH